MMKAGFICLCAMRWAMRLIGLVADGSHHGESEHDERDMPVPSSTDVARSRAEASVQFLDKYKARSMNA
jgi:hypothetical protein